MINITPAGRAMRVTEEEVQATINTLQEEVIGPGQQASHADLDHILHVNEVYGDVYDTPPDPSTIARDKQITREAVEHLRSQLPPRS